MSDKQEEKPIFTIRKDGTIDGTFFETEFAEIKDSAYDGGWLWVFADNGPTDIAVRFKPHQLRSMIAMIEAAESGAHNDPDQEPGTISSIAWITAGNLMQRISELSTTIIARRVQMAIDAATHKPVACGLTPGA